MRALRSGMELWEGRWHLLSPVCAARRLRKLVLMIVSIII